MAKHEGLLLKIDSKGNISGYMQENNNKIPIENTTIKNKILNDIGFCLENAQLMRQFSWSVSFDIPYWG